MTQTQPPGGAPQQPGPYGPPNQYGAPGGQYGGQQYGAPNQYGPPNQYGGQQYGAPNAYGLPPGAVPRQQSGPPPAGLGPQGHPPPSRSTNGLAIAALILGIVLAPIGLVLGIVALVQIRKRDQGGTGLAVAGIVIGGLGTLGVLAFVALLALATPTLNTDPIEAQISTTTTQVVGAAPSTVSCPDSVEVRPGAVFTCTAVLDGTQLPFQVTQKDDQGNVDILSNGWVSTAKAEQLLTDAAAPNLTGIPFTTTCGGGSKVVVGGPGTTFECVLSENANPSNVERHTATITSADGGIRFE